MDKKTISLLRNKYPSYKKILNFFEQVREEQQASKPNHTVQVTQIKKGDNNSPVNGGLPILERGDFVIDIPASLKLFESICKIAKNANEKMKSNIQSIEEAIAINAINLKELLRKFYDESFINRISAEFDIDKAILRFLIDASIRPSVDINAEKLKNQVDVENWRRGYCPVCGSLPQISLLNEQGQRCFSCSFCGFEWPSDRLKCPFCENNNHEKLHYIYAEGEEAYRIDVCDNCHQYIKTVDSRKLGHEPDLHLEDIVTIHLDILATEKGYKRPVRNIWGI